MNVENLNELEEKNIESSHYSFYDSLPHSDMQHYSNEYDVFKEESRKLHVFIQDMFLEHFFP